MLFFSPYFDVDQHFSSDQQQSTLNNPVPSAEQTDETHERSLISSSDPSNCSKYIRWTVVGPETVAMAGVGTMLRVAYLEMPPVTRAYTTACVLTTLAVQMEVVSPFQLYYNPLLIMKNYQLWRVVTTFLFFGTFGFNFLFNMIFTYRYQTWK